MVFFSNPVIMKARSRAKKCYDRKGIFFHELFNAIYIIYLTSMRLFSAKKWKILFFVQCDIFNFAVNSTGYSTIYGERTKKLTSWNASFIPSKEYCLEKCALRYIRVLLFHELFMQYFEFFFSINYPIQMNSPWKIQTRMFLKAPFSEKYFFLLEKNVQFLDASFLYILNILPNTL